MQMAIKYTDGQPEQVFETLAREAALQININGRAYSVTMCSPYNSKALVAGLLYTEGILNKAGDIIDISEENCGVNQEAFAINVNIHPNALEGKNLWNRSIASSASCGVCGKTTADDIYPVSRFIETTKKLNISAVPGLLHKMRACQSSFDETGGTHGAALFTIDNILLSVQEDIGRHNAVDKAIGELFLAGDLGKAHILLVSGRVSYEIVSKCAMAHIPFLLAVSAPSSMAVTVCRQKGITLVAFCRDNRATVYTHQQNIASFKSVPENDLVNG